MNAIRSPYLRLALSGVVALALTAALAAAPVPVKAVLSDLQYLPDGSNAIIVFHLDQLLASEGYKQLRGQVKEFETNMEKGFSGQFGMSMSQVGQMTIGGNVKGQPVIVLHLKTAATADSLRTALSKPRYQGDKPVTFTEEKVGAYTLNNPGQNYRESFCLVDNRTLLVSRGTDLKAVLERGTKKPEFGAGMKAALKEMDASAAAAFAIDLPSAIAADKHFLPPANPMFDVTPVAKNVDGLTGEMRLGKNKDVSLRLAAICKDAKSADEAKQLVDKGLMLAMGLLKDAPKEVPQSLRALPSKCKTTTKGKLAEATATTSQDTLVDLLKALFVGRISPAPNPPSPNTVPEKR